MTRGLRQTNARLLRQYATDRSQRLRDDIARLNDPLARSIAGEFAKSNRSLDYDDLLQIARIGLLKSIDRFDPDRSNSFSSYAAPFIRGEIRHWIRDKSRTVRLPRSWTDRLPRLYRLLQQTTSVTEIALALDLTEADTRALIAAYRQTDTVCWDDCHTLAAAAPTPLEIPVTRRADGLIDATAICQRYGRRFADYWRRRGKRYCRQIQQDRKLPKNGGNLPLFVIPRGGGRGRHSYVCEELAIDLVRWCHPRCEVWLDQLVAERLT